MALYNTIGTADEEEKKKSGTSSTTAAPASTTTTTAAKTPGYSAYKTYNPMGDDVYVQAMETLNAAKANKPTYANSYEGQLSDLYNRITGREDFSYDLSGDALYQQYRDQYANMGKLAMKDTMGQAAALTGGYGSSYGQAVGQQQYNAYLQNLNDVVPELYGMAYSRYQDEGDRLMQQYGMLGDMADDEYGKYQDAMSEYWQGVSYLQGQADDAYNRGYQQWSDGYAKQQDAYNQLVDLMMNLGYVPDEEELAAAGMSQAHADTYRNYYKKLHKSGGGGGGGGGGGRSYNAGTAAENLKADIDGGEDIYDVMSEIMNSNLSASEKSELVASTAQYAASSGKVNTGKRKEYDNYYSGYW